jgi:hypothetical protein
MEENNTKEAIDYWQLGSWHEQAGAVEEGARAQWWDLRFV